MDNTLKSIDIYCHVIDNFGDAGVAYRFANEIKIAERSLRVRVFVDDMRTLSAVVPEIDVAKFSQDVDDITYINSSIINNDNAISIGVADVMVEMFACYIPEAIMEMVYDNSKLIINLEYLTAEGWAEDFHLKESLLGRGSVKKYFFMPGFTKNTGGLIINSKLESERADGKLLDKSKVVCDIFGDDENCKNLIINDDTLVGTVFTYERGFDNLIIDLAEFGRDTVLLVFGEKSQRGMLSSLKRLSVNDDSISHDSVSQKSSSKIQIYKNIKIIYAPFVKQEIYDNLLCAADFNFVRGEDSLARAALAGKPFVWNAYIQEENYQLVKVKALLEMMRIYYEKSSIDNKIFEDYCDMSLKINSAPTESPDQTTSERYEKFFENLNFHKHAAHEIYYFILRNCNLIKNFINFINRRFTP